MFRVLLVVVTMLVVGGALRPAGAVAQEPLSISGVLWWDVDGDGIRQPNESGIGQPGITLYGPGNLRQTTRTAFSGVFTFSGLTPGEYVLEANFSGVYMTHPVAKYEAPFTRSVSLSSQSVTGADIGLYLPEGIPMYSGTVWINGAPVRAKVRAMIDEVDCTGPAPTPPPHTAANAYWLKVLSHEQKPGCGEHGDMITFTIDGMPAPQRDEWRPVGSGEPASPLSRSNFNLIIGPEFTVLYPYVVEHEPSEEHRESHSNVIVALIDGEACGTTLPTSLGGDRLIIKPRELPGGCGYEGAQITFAVNGYAADGIAYWLGEIDYRELKLELNHGPGSSEAGPAFAYYGLDIPAVPADYIGTTSQHVEARINGIFCGGAGAEGPWTVELAVAPDEVVDGCGVPGATVTFVYREEVIGAAIWQAGYQEGPVVPVLANAAPRGAPQVATPQQILPPGVGDGGLR